jgi:hypothetical protein
MESEVTVNKTNLTRRQKEIYRPKCNATWEQTVQPRAPQCWCSTPFLHCEVWGSDGSAIRLWSSVRDAVQFGRWVPTFCTVRFQVFLASIAGCSAWGSHAIKWWRIFLVFQKDILPSPEVMRMSEWWLIYKMVRLCGEQERPYYRSEKKQIVHVLGMQFMYPNILASMDPYNGFPFFSSYCLTAFFLWSFKGPFLFPIKSDPCLLFTWTRSYPFSSFLLWSWRYYVHLKHTTQQREFKRKNLKFWTVFPSISAYYSWQTKLNLAPNVTISSCEWPYRI